MIHSGGKPFGSWKFPVEISSIKRKQLSVSAKRFRYTDALQAAASSGDWTKTGDKPPISAQPPFGGNESGSTQPCSRFAQLKEEVELAVCLRTVSWILYRTLYQNDSC